MVSAKAAKGQPRQFHPARRREPATALADDLGERPFRTQDAAPCAPDENHAQQDEGPPDAPERELREQRHVRPDMRGAAGQRQDRRHDDQHDIDLDDCPLDASQDNLVTRQPVADMFQRAIDGLLDHRFRRPADEVGHAADARRGLNSNRTMATQ